MSSAHVDVYGSRSDNSIPHCPYGLNSRGLASTAAVGLMNASFKSFVSDGGREWPWYFFKAGFGSKRSIWLGAPSMNRKMMFLALPGKCGCLGASGSSTAVPVVAIGANLIL